MPIDEAIANIVTARRYTNSLLDNLEEKDWCRQPTEGVTHVAWQVGHLALVEYKLTLERVRGRRAEDAQLIDDGYVGLFGKGTTPIPDSNAYPSPKDLRATLDRVHAQSQAELPNHASSLLDEAVDPPHPMFATKRAAIGFCSLHEMIHAGQIGLLRRLLGYKLLR